MKEVRDRIGDRFDQCDGARDGDAARQQVGNAERHAEVNDGERGGLGEAQGQWNAHGRLREGMNGTLETPSASVHLIVPIASIALS
jgi:hypothetical protein